MRLPLPFLLYVTALGLFGWAGWTVYNSLELFDENTMMDASKGGLKKAQDLVKRGKGAGSQGSGVNYAAPAWWEQFKRLNLIGKLPPKQPTAEEIEQRRRESEKPKVDTTPLEDIFELVSLVFDGKDAGRGGDTHVIIRYKPPTKVQPPSWWLKENQPPGARAGGPRDLAAAPPTAKTRSSRGRGRRPTKTTPKATASAMPTTMSATRDGILQKIWIDDGGNQRRSAALWPPYGHISLARVASDAQSAFFVRAAPAPGEGEAAPEPTEEELLKTTAEIPQDVLVALRKLQGRSGERVARSDEPESNQNQWREVEETTRIGDQIHIGRKDEQRFRSSGDFFNDVYVDTYVSKTSSLRGVSVRSVQPKLAQTYGIQTGDVLLEVNSRKITSKAQATNMVKKDYQRGVRTFSTKWLSNGQVVERVYQAPDQ